MIADDVKTDIRTILKKSNYKNWNSQKIKNTLVIKGDLVEELISNNSILKIVDDNKLNIWSSLDKNIIYTFIQGGDNIKPRGRNFGFYHYNQKIHIDKLILLANRKVEIDESKKELYPWKFKYKFKNEDDFYYSQDWIKQKELFYSFNSISIRKCSCCGEEFNGNHNMLLDLHHKVTIKNGGDNSLMNLISICIGCHALLHHRPSILIDSLFMFYAKTGIKKVDGIKDGLQKVEPKTSKNSLQIFSNLFEQIMSTLNRAQAKLFFMGLCYSNYGWSRFKKFYEYADLYVECDKQYNDSYYSQDTFKDEYLASGELLFDFIIYNLRIYLMIDKLVFLEKENKFVNAIKSTRDTIELYNEDLKRFITENKIESDLLADLLFIIEVDYPFVKNCKFLSGAVGFNLFNLAYYLNEERYNSYHTTSLDKNKKFLEQRNPILKMMIYSYCSNASVLNNMMFDLKLNSTDIKYFSVVTKIKNINSMNNNREDIVKISNLIKDKYLASSRSSSGDMSTVEANDDLPF